MTLFSAITDATCGEACWSAREDVCRCSCGGKNHGITRNGAGIPERTRKKQGRVYKLIAVTGYGEACDLAREDYGSWLRNVGYESGTLYPHERIIYNRAQSHQLKWPEVQNNRVYDRRGEDDTYLVWERVGVPRTW